VDLARVGLDLERLPLVIDRHVRQRGLPEHAVTLVVGEVDHDPGRLGEPPVELPVRFLDDIGHVHHSSAGITWVTWLSRRSTTATSDAWPSARPNTTAAERRANARSCCVRPQ